ncbi:efflux RND transporter periplasmic adaptor subunit [Sphingomonas sp. LHG3406-1]|uniref:efflux RND transporter periplasmic adaptor subunit n=1 Tax=Sphingomonas sp. LHG3406-1 TaxID=2804617 RepID=UPI002620A32D|nr:efflux RND transporter periplasmic adaptor subunit [Sphingomonas sp. LHG3406-1]
MALLSSRPSFSRNILPIIAVVGLVIAAFLIWRGLPDRKLEDPDETPARATGALADAARVAGAGVVEPSSEVIDIGTSLSGLVTAVSVRAGDYVSRGQPLFQVDERATRARLVEAEAAIAQARAGIGEARAAEATAARQLALYRQISDPAAISRTEVIRAEGDVSAARERRRLAEAQFAAAQASRNSASVELGRLVVRAPISGEILRVDVRPGEFVQAGQQGSNSTPYLQMGETRPLNIRIDVDEDEAPRVALGQPASVSPRGAADRQVQARFVRAEPQVIPKRSLTNSAAERVDVRVLQLIYELPQRDDGLFRVGQQVDAFIPARPAKQRKAAAK